MKVHIGTSGWNYDHWKGAFFPEKCPKARWLEHYTSVFDTVELNASFYRSVKQGVFEGWYRRTPPGFLWSVKANRFITHIRRLRDAGESLERFVGSLAPLREKLGVVLLQLPPGLEFEPEAAEAFFRLLPASLRFTLEARNTSWTEPAALSLLRKYCIAWCMADTAGRYPFLDAVTTDFVYIRLHGSRELYVSDYTQEELSDWAGRIRAWDRDTYVYFDNDFMAHAPRNALDLRDMLA